jgi:hypothetical protein
MTKLYHQPIRPPRNGHLGEQVYAERWIELMASMPRDWSEDDYEDDYPPALMHLATIFWDMPGGYAAVDERVSRVCASFICWLGCAIGNATLNHAECLRAEHGDNCFLVAWTLHNQRPLGVNSGLRSLELMLAEESDLNDGGIFRCGMPLLRVPDLTVKDYEIVDHLTRWLGRGGKGFILGCEIEYRKRDEWQRVQRRATA